MTHLLFGHNSDDDVKCAFADLHIDTDLKIRVTLKLQSFLSKVFVNQHFTLVNIMHRLLIKIYKIIKAKIFYRQKGFHQDYQKVFAATEKLTNKIICRILFHPFFWMIIIKSIIMFIHHQNINYILMSVILLFIILHLDTVLLKKLFFDCKKCFINTKFIQNNLHFNFMYIKDCCCCYICHYQYHYHFSAMFSFFLFFKKRYIQLYYCYLAL